MVNYGFMLQEAEQLLVYVRADMVSQVSVTAETHILSKLPGMFTIVQQLLAIKVGS